MDNTLAYKAYQALAKHIDKAVKQHAANIELTNFTINSDRYLEATFKRNDTDNPIKFASYVIFKKSDDCFYYVYGVNDIDKSKKSRKAIDLNFMQSVNILIEKINNTIGIGLEFLEDLDKTLFIRKSDTLESLAIEYDLLQ